jgi:F-type H+-transporting ATPase subunit delta
MKYSIKQYVQGLYEALQDTKNKDHDLVIDNFVEVLKVNGDLAYYEKIVSAYEAYDKEIKGIKQVEFTTAKDGVVSEKLISELNALVGKNLELKKKIDESLIGGVTIKVDDTLIDASVKSQLDKLKNTLSNN